MRMSRSYFTELSLRGVPDDLITGAAVNARRDIWVRGCAGERRSRRQMRVPTAEGGLVLLRPVEVLTNWMISPTVNFGSCGRGTVLGW